MFDGFTLPEKYKVFKEYPKKWFVDHANLTKAEKKYIQAYAERIVVLYDIKFDDDSEIVVIYTEMNYDEYNPYILENYLNAIASSIPYKALIILKCRKKFKYIIYDAHTNGQNECRLVIDDFYSSSSITINDKNPDISHKFLVNDLQNAVETAHSAEELHEIWRDAIIENSGGLALCGYCFDDIY